MIKKRTMAAARRETAAEDRAERNRQWQLMTPAERRLAKATGFRPFGIKDRKTKAEAGR